VSVPVDETAAQAARSGPAPGVPPRARRTPWTAILGAVVSVLSLAGVVWWALGQEAPSLPNDVERWAALVGAIVLIGIATCVRGERWQGLLRHNGAHPSRADSYALVAVGYMGNNVLPARAGDAFRVVFMAPRAQTPARTVIGTLLAERLLDVAVLGSAFLILTFGVVDHAGLPSGTRLRFAAAAVVVLGVIAAVVVLVAHRRGHLARLWAFVAPMIAATARLRGRHGAEMVGITLVVWSLEAGVWWACGEAAGMHLGAVEACYLLALASMFAMIPSGPGYAGTMDAAVIFGARVLDRTPAAALSYLLLVRFVLFVPLTLAGLVLLVVRYGGWTRLRALRAT
jgi:glycosyltransferase 2 family protein